MGLYDKPLPHRPSPKEPNNDGNNNDDQEDQAYPVQNRLFAFDIQTGKEVRGLLPSLGRTLESGIGCYFEETDRLVVNLVGKTECHPEDAAWALEACRGDITEAWTRISVARRQLLDTTSDGFGLSSQVSELMAENEYEILKEERLEQGRIQRQKEYLQPGTPDENWLPNSNPKPVDEEPWFTG
jgi:hypothetical protein